MIDAGLAKKLKERYSVLQAVRSPWETLWQEIAKYVMPRRTPGLNGTIQGPNTANEALLFDTTAINANQVLANGQLAWMSPMEAAWFAFEPQSRKGSENTRTWLAEATETAREELALSNFYTAVHEFYLDRGAFGTACLYLEPGRRAAINAQVWPVGSFVIDEDADGIVDTVIREFKLTARQAAQKFGEDKISAKLREGLKDPKKALEKATFLHCIYPRLDAERDKAKKDAPNMPIASVYLESDGDHICQVGGYEEMPVMVSRYLEWGSGMGGLYGWSPAFAALPDARQINFLEKMGDALAEKAAFPPILAPEGLEGDIDANAMGVTYFSADLGGVMPREWMTAGRYDILVDRVKRREESIKQHFHTELFQMFAQIEKQMTAREVAERSSEKLIQFSPTFARLTGELFNPMLERAFGILARLGRFTPPPEQDADYRIQYSSRIALALRSLPALGYHRTLERLAVVAGMAPDALDNYNFDKAERATSLSDGVPPEFMRTEDEVKKLREARAQAAMEQKQKEEAMLAAEAAAKVGGIPPGSPVGEIIKGQFA